MLIVDEGGGYIEPKPIINEVLEIDKPVIINPLIATLTEKLDIPTSPVADKLLGIIADGKGISVDSLVYNIEKVIPIPVVVKAVQTAHPLEDLTTLEEFKLKSEFEVATITKEATDAWNTFKFIGIPLIIIFGVLGVGLVSFQYSKSYVSEKAKKRAS